ncbi:CPBP family intramembrane metalloprotease [Staphylococcus muscae]|uniref:CAAX amino protease n=1 Tax=Staphylococcus muscae TaxID=1294 RepID=A0A240C9U8_9STAP|nr:CPBP family intramembrane glutamic endopeptidase [Staphylococcus muscae]AVQ33693.1 CPBP family intramembrane metalloprotease [Staphylococcus muscae]PNZ03644.1 CPBP family intramembrane metalloprotease [Staphylococcus muscae]GGA86954.1 CAAX amino protease [Staphylococcus muscae]SNW04006.1 metal-dependent membrane protease [Staphylococcus muscae]
MAKYQWKDIAWRDLWLIPIFLVGQLAIGFMVVILSGILLLANVNLPEWVTSLDYYQIVETTSIVASYLLFIICFWLLHKSEMPERFRLGLQGVRRYWLWIVIAYVVMIISLQAYGYLTQFIPEQYQYETTQNEEMLESLMAWNALLPFNFMFIVVLAPIVEEIVFRNFLIGELGKKFNIYVMGVISVILFAGIHVISATSPFEMIEYLLLAIPMVWIYIKSGCNLGVSIALHMINNFVSFVLDIFF